MRQMPLVGRSVAVVGLGDVSFDRGASRGYDASEVMRAVHQAIEANIDLIEVAAEPDVERAVGDAIRTLRARDRVVLATRIPWLANTRDFVHARLPVGYVQERVYAALRATKLDALPLVQLPVRNAWRDAKVAWTELAGACARLVYEGDVVAWGAIVDARPERSAAAVIGSDLGDEPELAHEPWLASIAMPFSICERAGASVIAAASANKIAVFAQRSARRWCARRCARSRRETDATRRPARDRARTARGDGRARGEAREARQARAARGDLVRRRACRARTCGAGRASRTSSSRRSPSSRCAT